MNTFSYREARKDRIAKLNVLVYQITTAISAMMQTMYDLMAAVAALQNNPPPSLPYKSILARFEQRSADDPDVTEYFNNIGPVSWVRINTGSYCGLADSTIFPASRTAILIFGLSYAQSPDPLLFIQGEPDDEGNDDKVYFTTRSLDNVQTVDLNGHFFFEIRVYPEYEAPAQEPNPEPEN